MPANVPGLLTQYNHLRFVHEIVHGPADMGYNRSEMLAETQIGRFQLADNLPAHMTTTRLCPAVELFHQYAK
jgi:hypothetical protein